MGWGPYEGEDGGPSSEQEGWGPVREGYVPGGSCLPSSLPLNTHTLGAAHCKRHSPSRLSGLPQKQSLSQGFQGKSFIWKGEENAGREGRNEPRVRKQPRNGVSWRQLPAGIAPRSRTNVWSILRLLPPEGRGHPGLLHIHSVGQWGAGLPRGRPPPALVGHPGLRRTSLRKEESRARHTESQPRSPLPAHGHTESSQQCYGVDTSAMIVPIFQIGK